MTKLLFNRAYIRHIDARMKDGIIFSRIHLTAELTRDLADERGWAAALDTHGWDSMELTSEPIRVTALRLSVDGLKQKLAISGEEIRAFNAVRVEERGSTRVEVRFMAITKDHAELIYGYWGAAGEAKGDLVATLQDEPAQETLPGVPVTAPEPKKKGRKK